MHPLTQNGKSRHELAMGALWTHTKGTAMTEKPLTISVPEAGKRYFGLSRNGAYAAAERGEIPTIRIGKLLKVPVRALEQMLDSAKKAEAA
jgi:hypothetical protein